jgi:hypothetical protein
MTSVTKTTKDETTPNAAFAERVLSKYGLATLLALGFFYWVTTDVSGSIKAVQVTLSDHISESTYYLRQVCINTAKDETQRAACIAPRVGH